MPHAILLVLPISRRRFFSSPLLRWFHSRQLKCNDMCAWALILREAFFQSHMLGQWVDEVTLIGAVHFLALISVEALPRGSASRQCPEGRRLTQASKWQCYPGWVTLLVIIRRWRQHQRRHCRRWGSCSFWWRPGPVPRGTAPRGASIEIRPKVHCLD